MLRLMSTDDEDEDGESWKVSGLTVMGSRLDAPEDEGAACEDLPARSGAGGPGSPKTFTTRKSDE